MKPYQEQVVVEKDVLDNKRKNLAMFFDTDTFEELDAAEKVRLQHQLMVMWMYSEILGDRIAAFAD